MTRSDFPFFETIRVRYSEIDAQGIVFNAHYLTYFDVALNEYLRWIEFDYHDMLKTEGLDFHLVKSTVEYLGPIHFDEDIEIGVRPKKVGNSSLTWELGIFRKGEADCEENDKCLALGEIIWVCCKSGSHKSHALPSDLIEKLK